MSAREADHVILGGGIVGCWLARRLTSLGRSVVVVEIGPATADGPVVSRPPLVFPERENLGAVQARRQALTGNAPRWGGAFIRNDAPSLAGLLDRDDDAAVDEELRPHYDAVERAVGAREARRFDREGTTVAEVNVLPGRRRNLARAALDACASSPQLVVRCGAVVEALEHGEGGRIEAIGLRHEDGSREVVRPRQVVLSMGVIDSNVFALEHLAARPGVAAERIGTRLHDHWSVPVGTLRYRPGSGLDWLYPPTFAGSLVQGRRAELAVRTAAGERRGFLHIQALYDEIEPYATLKACMNARQAGESWPALVRRMLPLARHVGRMGRIGYDRYVGHRLFVPEGLELTAVMDFESHAHEANRLSKRDGEWSLHWDVRDEDVETFTRMAPLARRILEGIGADWTAGESDGAMGAALRSRAIDAYHLGGGLAAGRDVRRGVVDPTLRFHGIPNLSVLGTAAFARPGIANPVETLLAAAERHAARRVEGSSAP